MNSLAEKEFFLRRASDLLHPLRSLTWRVGEHLTAKQELAEALRAERLAALEWALYATSQEIDAAVVALKGTP